MVKAPSLALHAQVGKRAVWEYLTAHVHIASHYAHDRRYQDGYSHFIAREQWFVELKARLKWVVAAQLIMVVLAAALLAAAAASGGGPAGAARGLLGFGTRSGAAKGGAGRQLWL